MDTVLVGFGGRCSGVISEVFLHDFFKRPIQGEELQMEIAFRAGHFAGKSFEGAILVPLISWNDRLSVGITLIDDDHKRLLRMTNDLFDGIFAGNGQQMLNGLFDELLDYAQTHFRREEELFEKSEYPYTARHKQDHQEMLKWASDARARFHQGTLAGPSLEVMNYLKDWLFQHIGETDQQMAPYLMRAGLV